jgi:hypothetical protein
MYKKIKSIVINNQKRNLYVKKNSKKLYIKHKGIYITYTSYKKKLIKKGGAQHPLILYEDKYTKTMYNLLEHFLDQNSSEFKQTLESLNNKDLKISYSDDKKKTYSIISYNSKYNTIDDRSDTDYTKQFFHNISINNKYEVKSYITPNNILGYTTYSTMFNGKKELMKTFLKSEILESFLIHISSNSIDLDEAFINSFIKTYLLKWCVEKNIFIFESNNKFIIFYPNKYISFINASEPIIAINHSFITIYFRKLSLNDYSTLADEYKLNLIDYSYVIKDDDKWKLVYAGDIITYTENDELINKTVEHIQCVISKLDKTKECEDIIQSVLLHAEYDNTYLNNLFITLLNDYKLQQNSTEIFNKAHYNSPIPYQSNRKRSPRSPRLTTSLTTSPKSFIQELHSRSSKRGYQRM